MAKIYKYGDINIDPHPSWVQLLEDNEQELRMIGKTLECLRLKGENYNPDPENVLRFAKTDLDSIKVIVLGMDPYSDKKDERTGRAVATGRAFEVGTLDDWSTKFNQPSLQNIIRNLYRSEHGELKNFIEIRSEIKSGSFSILPPNKIFDHWENEGVLMLNVYLTCKTNEKAGSHKDHWDKFSKNLLRYISSYKSAKKEPITWFLWGNAARALIKVIYPEGKPANVTVYESWHPRRNDRNNDTGFLNSNCFMDTDIDWIGCRIK